MFILLKSPNVEAFAMGCYFCHGLPSSFPSFLKRKPRESRHQIRTCCLVCLLPQKPITSVDEWRRSRLQRCMLGITDVVTTHANNCLSTHTLRSPFLLQIRLSRIHFVPFFVPLVFVKPFPTNNARYAAERVLYSSPVSLYSPRKRAFAMRRIQGHYYRFALARRGVCQIIHTYVRYADDV
jgi:hypothetical protein